MITDLPEAALIDPYFENGAFFVRAPLGQRGRIRSMIRDLAASATPPREVWVNSGSRIQGCCGRLYVEVVG